MQIPIIFAKLAGLYKSVKQLRDELRFSYHDQIGRSCVGYRDTSERSASEYVSRYEILRDQLMQSSPEFFADLPIRNYSETKTAKVSGFLINELCRDLEYIFEVQANSEPVDASPQQRPDRIFISHGRSQDWREVQAYIEKDLEKKTLELAQEANRGRTLLQKLDEESERCSFAVIVMTGDDEVQDSAPRVRENVMHEIGYFQGKYGLANVCLLHEVGTSIPSNFQGVVYISFPGSGQLG